MSIVPRTYVQYTLYAAAAYVAYRFIRHMAVNGCPWCFLAGCHGPDEPVDPQLLHPLFNVRECCKELWALEDHLNKKGKRCFRCISKHFLGAELLAEEAIMLDKQGAYHCLHELPQKIRTIARRYLEKQDPCLISQELRVLRNKFTHMSFPYMRE
jgi:hypothetical protein